MSCITGLPSCKSAAENRIYNEKPSGAFDCVNTIYTTAQPFAPDTILVRLDGVALDPSQYTLGGDNQTITLIVDANDPKALNEPLDNEECLRVDYNINDSAITGDDCITFL
jgi:hypothetical protein